MNEMTPPKSERSAALKGLGTSRKRVEDARFTQGKGNYIDDLKLPGMLFGDFVRSPYPHAYVKSINTDAAMAVPGVVAVLTAADLEPLGLHWMPTLAGDKQMVLADGKVLFQGQEVAFVVASDRYAAADAVELVEVEYEEQPVLVDPFKAEIDGAPVLREDIADNLEGAHGARRHPNHIFTWEAGEKEQTEAAIGEADVVAEEMVYYHRTHPCHDGHDRPHPARPHRWALRTGPGRQRPPGGGRATRHSLRQAPDPHAGNGGHLPHDIRRRKSTL